MTSKSIGSKSPDLRTRMGCLQIDGNRYPLYEGVNTIGRNMDATVTLRDMSVSQQHALIIIINENQHFLSDLHSFNGTIVEHNILSPMLLYELSQKTVINFASCKATYEKVPGNSQSITHRNRNSRIINATQKSLNLSESFYSAPTQAFENVPTAASADLEGPTCNYFEDDYNFAEIPSPPMHQVNQEDKITLASTSDKSGLSIHEMPTQLYASVVVNDVVVGDSQTPALSNTGYQIVTTKADVHELPTQMFCHEIAANESVDKTQPDIALHDMPTQIIDNISNSKEKSTPFDVNTESKSLCNETLDDTRLCEIKANNSNMADISSDIIEETRLDDSGLDVTAQSLQSNKSGGGSVPAPLESLDSNSQSHVSQLHSRSVKAIADDAEEDNIVSSGSDIINNSLRKKSKPISESEELSSGSEIIKDTFWKKIKPISESEESNSEEIGKQKKKCHVLHSDNSDTDIEELQDPTKPNTSKLERNKTEAPLNYSDSDTDAEDFEFGARNKANKEKAAQNLNNLSKLDETDVIPTTQISKDDDDDDDDDDFNFMPEISSTLLNKESSNQPQERIFDVSQTLKELREKCVMPQNCSEESFHLRLSELEGSEAAKHPEEQAADNKIEDDDDKTPDISDDDEPITESEDIANKKTVVCKKVDEDVVAMATQKLSEDVLIQKEEDDRIFAKPTTSKCFSKMRKQGESQNDRAKYSQDTEDDLFMQPTQPVLADNIQSKERNVSSTTTNDDDIFMQPTQKYEVDSQDDIFMQPTQQVVPGPLSHYKPLIVSDQNQPNDDIYMQPTQRLDTEPATDKRKHRNENIFMQPTQLVEVVEPKIGNKPNNDDIFMQSTQQVVSDNEKNIFMQSTRVFSVASPTVTKKLPNQSTQQVEPSVPKDNIKLDDDDLFMQATQKITDVPSNEPDSNSLKVMQSPQKPSLSLHKKSTKRDKSDDVESQLEVMFASQTLRMSSQKNSRPLNPLVNVLDGKPIANSEPNSEEPAVEVHDTSRNENTKSPESGNSLSSSDELKEYCARSTLPMDELTDEQNKQPKKRGRPAIATPVTPPKANVSVSPRKRGRPWKSEAPKTISEINNILDSTRKSKRTRKIIDGGKAIIDVVAASKQGLEKVADTRSKRSLEQEPSPGTSTSGIQNQTEDEGFLKNKTATSCQDEDNNEVNEKYMEIIDVDDELKTAAKNVKQKLASNRVTRKNKADENTIKTKNKRDDDGDSAEKNKDTSKSAASTSGVRDTSVSNIQNSKTDEAEDKQEIIENRTRTKTNLTKPLNTNKRITRNTVTVSEETNENERTSENTDKDTNKRKTKTPNKLPTTLNEVEEPTAAEGRRSRRNKIVEPAQIISISSDNSETHSEKSNTPMPSTVNRRKANNKTKLEEESAKSKISPAEAGPSALSRRESNIVNTNSETPVGRRAQTRRTTANLETTDIKPVTSNASCSVAAGKSSKRLLSSDSEVGKSKPLPKKLKNVEGSEHEETASNSDHSEISFQTPRKNVLQLNVTSTPDRIRRIQKPKVVFTMLNSPQLESLVRRLGGTIVDSVSACTVLVTGSLKRSQKLLAAVGEGKPICSPKWLDECKKENKFLDPWDYILEDEEAESKWNLTLKESLNRSQNQKLLQDYTIVLTVTEALDVLKAAIESCGGKCVLRVPPKNVENNLIIVANPNKKASYSKFLKQNPPATVVAPEAIFDGVLRQEFHWKDHMLS